jgi:hypothetical protein
VSIQDLKDVRDRVLPMFEAAAEQYMYRVPQGYPAVVDNADQGLIGLEIDPNYSLYITSEGNDLYAEIYRRQGRHDAQSSSSRQKYGGAPFHDRRPLPADVDDQTLRNLVAELKSRFNMQGGFFNFTDD